MINYTPLTYRDWTRGSRPMPTIDFISPLDQPTGHRRLLEELKAALCDARFSDFKLIVAYAKSGPLYRLRDALEQWRHTGKRIDAIIGIDQQGTSQEALGLALTLFDTVHVTQEPNITFHPKFYLFKGASNARAFVGSNNLTVGGTEMNFEAAVQIDLVLPDDAAILGRLEIAWRDLATCPATKVLDAALLAQLVADGDVVDERSMRQGDGDPEGAPMTGRRRPPRSGLVVKPGSPLPKTVLKPTTIMATVTRGAVTAMPTPAAAAQKFAIQIKPHHNGEIFLSVTATLQNPEFFKWPFTGTTIPKKPDNPSYPQLDPDPVVNITVYGAATTPLITLSSYKLNTVYYENKSEIRITASPLVNLVPEYSVMIIERGETPEIDYEITIHTPESPDYAAWVAVCDQTMPSGGKTPRKFGWF
jgi:hypothetical protein